MKIRTVPRILFTNFPAGLAKFRDFVYNKSRERYTEISMTEKYESRLRGVYENETLGAALRCLSYAAVGLTVYACFYLLLTRLSESPWLALKLAVILAVPFVLVTVLRRLLNFPRPYEVLDFYENKPKKKKGCSFPSRHASSAFSIGTLMLFYLPTFGMGVLAGAIVLCVCRVLLGIHFPRDVVAGGAIGVAGALIGQFLITLI